MDSRSANAELPVARPMLKRPGETVDRWEWNCGHPMVSVRKVRMACQIAHNHVVLPMQGKRISLHNTATLGVSPGSIVPCAHGA